MSAKAMEALFEHAEGSDAEWRMLTILADAADRRGVVAGVSMPELAELVGKTERGAGQIKRRLIDSGQLVVLDEGGGRGRTASYWLSWPGLAGPVTPKRDQETLPAESGNEPKRSNQEEKKTSSSSSPAALEAAFREVLRDCEVPDEMVADGASLLRDKRKVAGRLVTPEEMAIAAAGLASFNREFEWKGKKGADFGLGSALSSIVLRARARPSWAPAKHVRLVESAWRIRWWEQVANPRRPTPNVVWGPEAFEQCVQDAKEEHEGKTGKVRYGRKARGS